MVVLEARYIFVHEIPNECSYKTEREQTYTSCIEDKEHMVGFVHYRFTLEEEIPVLYVYELQLESRVQGKGLGKFLMLLIDLIAQKNRMGTVILTVQKANSLAMNFYLNKLRSVMLLRSNAFNKSWLINEPTTMYQQINIVILKPRK